MKVFTSRQLQAAVDHALEGGQSLHLHRYIVNRAKAPRCFLDALRRGEDIAHLFDQNLDRLLATAKRLGVKTIRVEYEGTTRQHIDLCGQPLKAALLEVGQ